MTVKMKVEQQRTAAPGAEPFATKSLQSTVTAGPTTQTNGPAERAADAQGGDGTPDSHAAPVRASQRRRGVRAVGVLLGVSLLSGGIGWLVASRLSSPADVAARTAAPAASRIVAPVEFRVLRSTLFTRGTVRFGSPKPITLPGSAVKTGSQIVTAPPVKGAVITEGGKIADVSGRPVLALVGAVPMYRDIHPNDSGSDVAALKTSLRRLGFDAGSGSVFDEQTERAVATWFKSIGYDPFGATAEQLDRLKLATDTVRKSTEQIRSVREALLAGTASPTPDKILAANETVVAARDRVAVAQDDAGKANDQAALSIAQRELSLASAEAAAVAADLAVARIGVDVSAQLSLAESTQNVAAAKQRVTDAEQAVTKAEGAIQTASADADDAGAAVLDAQTSLDEANAGLTRARADLETAKTKTIPTIVIGEGASRADNESYGAAIRQAELGVTGATTSVRSATTQLRTAQRGVVRAETAITDAQAALSAAKLQVIAAKESVTIAELRAKQAAANTAAGNGASNPAASGVLPGSATASNATPPSSAAGESATGVSVSPPASPASPASSGSSAAASASGSANSPANPVVPSGSAGAAGGSAAVNINGGSDPVARQAQARKSRDIAATELDQARRAIAPAQRAQVAAIRSAEAQLNIAIASREQLGKPTNATGLRSAVTTAEASAIDAKTELARLESATGTVVPANEILFFGALPLRIDDSKLAAGDALAGVFMTVSTQRVAVDSSVDPADASGLRVGQDAEIEASDLQITLKAKITEVASSTGTKGAAAGRIYVELTPAEDEATQPAAPSASDPAVADGQPRLENRKPRLTDLNGLPVKVTIPVSSTGGKVLAVPTAAVSAAIDGTTRVEVEDTPGAPTRLVRVTAGLRAEGYVQITPTKPSEIKEGDTVVTGTSNGKLLEGVPGVNDKAGVNGKAGASDLPGASPTDASAPTP
jgi:multidrug efflux pump subunit AcrA (membrane-fusion protein)